MINKKGETYSENTMACPRSERSMVCLSLSLRALHVELALTHVPLAQRILSLNRNISSPMSMHPLQQAQTFSYSRTTSPTSIYPFPTHIHPPSTLDIPTSNNQHTPSPARIHPPRTGMYPFRPSAYNLSNRHTPSRPAYTHFNTVAPSLNVHITSPTSIHPLQNNCTLLRRVCTVSDCIHPLRRHPPSRPVSALTQPPNTLMPLIYPI
ncbi:hypothetical protein JAAARDRAFT_530590 [Jaapia argillacea MUCL 33604]|uniref:Uncharacterized protein n=1 Tax=Jaapia argillacea MUCL 33604 TaxID=933084 RepID=A0A067PMA2_9AGAM|nr:hypothetical protein JAAARDRAFT_530590 [Jaapia argillacea MUCL 33604]